MNTSQINKSKGPNLSVTTKSQKTASNIGFSGNGTGQGRERGRARSNKYNTLTKLSACSDGICSLNWKPYNPAV